MRFRLFLGVLFFTILITAILGAQNKFRTKGSGLWSNYSNIWEVYDTVSQQWVSASRYPAEGDTITIRSGDSVNTGMKLTVNYLVIESGATLVIDVDTLKISNGPEVYDLVIYGTLHNKKVITIGTNARWRIGGTYIHNTGTAISAPLNFAAIEPNSTFEYRDAGTAVTISGRTYGHLKFTTASSYSPSPTGSVALTVNGTFTIGSGVVLNLTGFT
ncbi:MAG: hypothetical protein ACK44H_07800, partial [Candidatus Kryptonium sp.]